MNINFSPVRSDDQLSLSVSGKTLTINGTSFDFCDLSEGDNLPAEAIETDFINEPVTVENGTLSVTVLLPHGKDAPEEARFPETVSVESGEVPLPAYNTDEDGVLVLHDPEILSGAGSVDFTKKVTKADKENSAKEEWREGASLDRTDFAFACVKAGVITMGEAKAWLRTGDLPAVAKAGLTRVLDPDQALKAELAFIGANSIARNNPFLKILQAELGISDDALDTLFGKESE